MNNTISLLSWQQEAMVNWEYIKDLKYEYELSRDALILKLHLLGWNQTEISELVVLHQTEVGGIIKGFKENLKTLKNSYHKGKTIEKIASD